MKWDGPCGSANINKGIQLALDLSSKELKHTKHWGKKFLAAYNALLQTQTLTKEGSVEVKTA